MKAIAEKKSEKFDFNRIQTNVPPRFKLHGHFFHQLGHKATFLEQGNLIKQVLLSTKELAIQKGIKKIWPHFEI